MELQLVSQIREVGGALQVSSKDVAETFGKRHADLLRAIGQLECSNDFRQRNFAPNKITVLNNASGEETSEFLMTRDGFVFLAMGFTGAKAAKFKEAYITAFNEMEKRLTTKLPANPLDFLQGMLDSLRATDRKLELITTRTEQIEQQGTLTSGEIIDLERRMKQRAEDLQRHGAARIQALSYMKAALKRRFLPTSVRGAMTWKEISRANYTAACELIDLWLG